MTVLAMGRVATPAPARAPQAINLTARDEPVRDVLMRLGETARLNITVAPDVQGKVSVALHGATPGEALDAICGQLRLRCARQGRSVLVTVQNSAVVPLSLIPASRAAKVLRGIFPRLAVSEAGSGNTLVLAGSDADIQAAKAVVLGLDVRDPRKPATEAITLHTQPAATVAERLQMLYPAARITLVNKSTMLVSATPADLAQMKAVVAGIDAASPPATAAPIANDAVKIAQRSPAEVARGVSAQLPHVRVGVSGAVVTLSGAPDDVMRARSLIAQLDVPPFGTRYTQIYRIRNVDADSVAKLVHNAFPKVDVSVDASLNALSVTATAAEQQRIAEGIAQLDGTAVANTGGGGSARITGPAGAEEGQPGSIPGVAAGGAGGGGIATGHEIVQLRSIVPGLQGVGTSASDIASAVVAALQPAHPDLRVTVPNGTQTLIITGTPSSIRDAKDLIKGLDIIPQSVVLDTEILELDENSSRNLGLQLGTTSIGSTFTEVGATPAPSGAAGRLSGFTALTRTPITFFAAVNLLMQNGKARVLADPRITTMSGRTATIRAGDTISILTTVGGGTGTVATTQLQSFQTGVTLDITPIITDMGELSVALHPIVNSLTGFTNGVPQISTRDTQTTVHLRDNETLVIGGLIQENTQRQENKIPFLGDLPLIGRIFRNENTTSTRNELIIVVTPHILGNEKSTVPSAAQPPGMVIPTPRPLPTLPPNVIFPASPAATPTPAPAASPAPGRTAQPVDTGGKVRAATTGSPAPSPASTGSPLALPSAFAQANTFVYGSPPPNTYAGPGDVPQIFYATLTPTVFTPNATVRINAITTTNVQRLTIGTGTSSIGLSPVGPGTWQGVFSANVLGLPPAATSLRLTLVAARSDGQNASIPITVSIMRAPSTSDTPL